MSRHNARIIEINPTHGDSEIGNNGGNAELYDDLKEIGILQFVRSGPPLRRVAWKS